MINRCEAFSRYIQPACQSVIAKLLIDRYHFTQTTVGTKLRTTQGAISNYLAARRGKKYVTLVTEQPQVMTIISELVDQLATNSISDDALLKAYCDICTLMQPVRV